MANRVQEAYDRNVEYQRQQFRLDVQEDPGEGVSEQAPAAPTDTLRIDSAALPIVRDLYEMSVRASARIFSQSRGDAPPVRK